MRVLPLLICLGSAYGHVPFFASGSDNQLELKADISQVYYFKESGKVYGKTYMPRNDIVELVGPESELKDCQATIVCDTNTTLIQLSTSSGSSPEPFTQSKYYKYFSEKKNCESLFSVEAVCGQPWGAVVGKKEVQYVSTILSFPVIIARIHGSWWNDLYIVGWTLLLLPLIPLLSRVLFQTRSLSTTLLFAAGLTYIAFFVDKLANTVTYTPDSFLAWVFTFIELLPLILVWRLLVKPTKLLVAIAIITALVLFFCLGIGFYLGNIFLLAATALMYDKT